MATFICCADESTDGRQQTDFFYGGFAASEDTWEEDFAPAWNERVLKGPPSLDYLHMSSIVRESGDGHTELSDGTPSSESMKRLELSGVAEA
jgi:hypothetical protein